MENALVAAEAGADSLGFVLAPSRRQVHPSLIVQVRDRLTDMSNPPRLVTVVVNESEDTLRQIVDLARPDAVQLSGDEDVSILDAIEAAVFRTVRVPEGSTYDQACVLIDPWLEYPKAVKAVLFEAQLAGHFGGTGKVADWDLAARLAETYPLILAGGLSPENVTDGIMRVSPRGVDVSSGVEFDGIKDPDQIRLFINTARKTFSAMGAIACPVRSSVREERDIVPADAESADPVEGMEPKS